MGSTTDRKCLDEVKANRLGATGWAEVGCASDVEIQGWRRYGFSVDETRSWRSVVIEHSATFMWIPFHDTDEDLALLAAGWVVAGFDPAEASEWIRVLPKTVPLAEVTATAKDWRAAGFFPREAAAWCHVESLDDAVLLANGGWRQEDRDLLDVLCLHHLVSGQRRDYLSTAASPREVTGYALAGVAPTDITYWQRLVREGTHITAVMDDKRAALSPVDSGVALELNLAIARQRRAFGDTVDPDELYAPPPLDRRLHSSPQAPLPNDFVAPSWDGSSIGDETFTVGYGGWDGYWPPEDSACTPDLDWTEAHRESVQAAILRQAASWLDGDGYLDLEWPPRASLWSDGMAHEGEETECDEHQDERNDDCWECAARASSVRDYIEPAGWHWHVKCTIFDVQPDGSQDEIALDSVHIMTSWVDPRLVEHSHMG